jgi:hypothetical protein
MSELMKTHQWGYYKPEGLVLLGLNLINYKLKAKPIKKILTRILKIMSPVFDVEYMGARFRFYVKDNATERSAVFF